MRAVSLILFLEFANIKWKVNQRNYGMVIKKNNIFLTKLIGN